MKKRERSNRKYFIFTALFFIFFFVIFISLFVIIPYTREKMGEDYHQFLKNLKENSIKDTLLYNLLTGNIVETSTCTDSDGGKNFM